MFKLGDKVFDIHFGWGTVLLVNNGAYPVLVDFLWTTEDFTIDGRYEEDSPRSLFHHDYTPSDEIQIVDSRQVEVKSQQELLREKLAGMAMNSILNTEYSRWFFNEDSEQTSDEIYDNIALMSVCMADALIRALNEKP